MTDTPGQPGAGTQDPPTDDPSLVQNDPINNDPNPIGGDPAPSGDPTPTDDWHNRLSDDIKAHPKIQSYKTENDLARGYLELQTLLGHEKVALPKDDKDTVAIEHLNRALGVPEAPEGYKLEEPAKIPGMEDIEFGVSEFEAVAHKHNLTPKQAQGILGEYRDMLASVRETMLNEHKAAVEESKAALTKEWGAAYEPNVKLAQSVMNKFAGSKEAFDHINAAIGADPVALKMFAEIGKNFSEGTLGDLGHQGTSFTKTPAQAKEEYESIMADPDDIYWAGVQNKKAVSESARKARIEHVEDLLRMSQVGGNA
jgi:hypothetical protein